MQQRWRMPRVGSLPETWVSWVHWVEATLKHTTGGTPYSIGYSRSIAGFSPPDAPGIYSRREPGAGGSGATALGPLHVPWCDAGSSGGTQLARSVAPGRALGFRSLAARPSRRGCRDRASWRTA